MDTRALDTAPAVRRLAQLLAKRGWKGWTKLERVGAPQGWASGS